MKEKKRIKKNSCKLNFYNDKEKITIKFLRANNYNYMMKEKKMIKKKS